MRDLLRGNEPVPPNGPKGVQHAAVPDALLSEYPHELFRRIAAGSHSLMSLPPHISTGAC
jgi:hypothetical protein